MHRHEIGNLGSRIVAAKAGDENVGLGEVNLAVIDRIYCRYRKPTAFFVIEKTVENGWRIEERQTQSVDRAVVADQRCRVHISDQTVIFNPFKNHNLP
jgi:hypothetical protein